MIYITSDTHFYHKNIIEYCNRPFSDVEEMNEVLIENWNNTVSKEDTVFHLGDFTMAEYIQGKSYAERYIHTATKLIHRLNGKIILIKGNHDPSIKILKELPWSVSSSNQRFGEFILSHKPIFNCDAINIHGHMHDKMPFIHEDGFNVSVDVTGFKPVKLLDIRGIVNKDKISKFCKQLEETWQKFPSLRFNQLLYNLYMRAYNTADLNKLYPIGNDALYEVIKSGKMC